MTCCPSASPSAGATVRAVMSTFPPGGHGTTIRTGRAGNSWAWRRTEKVSAAMPPRNCFIGPLFVRRMLFRRYGAIDADQLLSLGAAHEPEEALDGRRRWGPSDEEDFTGQPIPAALDVLGARRDSVDGDAAQPAPAFRHRNRRRNPNGTRSHPKHVHHGARLPDHLDCLCDAPAFEASEAGTHDLGINLATRRGVGQDREVRAAERLPVRD